LRGFIFFGFGLNWVAFESSNFEAFAFVNIESSSLLFVEFNKELFLLLSIISELL
jgi:hypothetical protein